MITAGEVGAVFKIVDEASPVLKKLMDQFTALQGVIDRTALAMKEIKFPAGLNKSLGTLDAKLKSITDSAAATAGAVGSSFEKMDASIATTAEAIAKLKTE